MTPALLSIDGLVVDYATGADDAERRAVRALDGVDLELGRGETLAIVGESGSGKSTLGLAIGRLLPPEAARTAGDLRLDGTSVFDCDSQSIRALRRQALGFVFQNPMSALDPTMRIGRQVARAMTGRPDDSAVADLLGRAGLPEPRRLLRAFPHELSGGMAQRVAIAIAIARGPALLLADEPTASLDAAVRETVMATLMTLRQDSGASLVILSHDLNLVARHCERVCVMYGGRIVEAGRIADVFARPAHPYTAALLRAAAGTERPGERLEPIPGNPPLLYGRPLGCAFAPRCRWRQERCETHRPEEHQLAQDNRTAACHAWREVVAQSEVLR